MTITNEAKTMLKNYWRSWYSHPRVDHACKVYLRKNNYCIYHHSICYSSGIRIDF